MQLIPRPFLNKDKPDAIKDEDRPTVIPRSEVTECKQAYVAVALALSENPPVSFVDPGKVHLMRFRLVHSSEYLIWVHRTSDKITFLFSW
jgi:hypothetical protein